MHTPHLYLADGDAKVLERQPKSRHVLAATNSAVMQLVIRKQDTPASG
jgi:hypothetical protein